MAKWTRLRSLRLYGQYSTGSCSATLATAESVRTMLSVGVVVLTATSLSGDEIYMTRIAVSKAGLVYVADSDNHRVQVFTAAGKFVRKWGSEGGGNGQFEIAEDVEIAPDGTVWVADQQNSRIQGFSATGAFKTAFVMPDGIPRAVGVAQDGSVIEAHNGSRFGGFRRWFRTDCVSRFFKLAGNHFSGHWRGAPEMLDAEVISLQGGVWSGAVVTARRLPVKQAGGVENITDPRVNISAAPSLATRSDKALRTLALESDARTHRRMHLQESLLGK